MTRRGGRCLGEKKWDRGGREAAGDGETSRLKTFQFGDIGMLNSGEA